MAGIFRGVVPSIRGLGESLLSLEYLGRINLPYVSSRHRFVLPCVICHGAGFNSQRSFHTTSITNAPPPKKGTGAFKAGMTVTKKKIDVETDPHKLVNHLCGGQYLKEGPEIKLKPDSEYPDWLWKLRTTGRPDLSELDPNTVEYWNRVYILQQFEYKRLQKAARGRYWEITMQRRHIKRKALWDAIKKWKETGAVSF